MTIQSERLKEANLLKNGVVVKWNDDHQTFYHAIWLRHSPGFPGSVRPAGIEGRFPTIASPITPIEADVTPDGNLKIDWNNGFVSEHSTSWLRENAYDEQTLSQKRRAVTLWDPGSIEAGTEFQFSAFVDDEKARIELFEHLLDYGALILRHTPTDPNTIVDIANWFGHTPANLYADDPAQPVVGNVKIDPAVTVATNMCHFLGPHTDTCWRQTLSGLVLLHCLKAHPGGGRSIVVDGFAVANRLREEDQAAFDLLAKVPLDFGSKVDDKDDWRVLGRIISVAANGQLEGIRYNGNSIGQLELPLELVEPVYQALEKFEAILYDRRLWWQPLLQPGDLLIVDNHRVLHGREAFDPGIGERHLQTCSVDRDDFHNRYRRLAKKLNRAEWNQRLCAGVI